MSFIDDLKSFFFPPSSYQQKSATVLDLPTRTADQIRADLEADTYGVSAIQLSAVYACARVIAEGLAQVPCHLQRPAKNGGREDALDHPLFELLNRRPNSFMTDFEFREWLGFRLAITGNAFVYVVRNGSGQPIELLPLPDGSVSVTQNELHEVVYTLTLAGQPAYYRDNIWHLKGPSWSGIHGLALQSVAANALGLSADLESFGRNLFRNAAKPSGILTTDLPLSADQQAALSTAWNDSLSGVANAHKTALLSNGLKYQQLQTSANDAQFVEARRYQTEEVCRMLRVDPLMVQQATNSAAYASIEQRFLAHLTHCLAPWFRRFTQSAENALLSKAERVAGYRIHLDDRQLLRGSAVERANYLQIMSLNGFMSQNECRDFEGLDRSSEPSADLLRPAANLYGMTEKPSE